MRSDFPIVDGHGHMLPRPNEIPHSIKDAGYFDIIGEKGNQFMTQAFINWKRPVSDETFFIEPRLEWMAKWNIAHTVVLPLSQLYCNGINKAATLDIIRFQNDFHLELETLYPNQITAGFVVQPRFIDEALMECERMVRQGLKILCLPTHYLDENEDWVSCTDANCLKLYEYAHENNLAVQNHPYDYERMIKIKDLDKFGCGHVMAMPFLTGLFHYQFTCNNIQGKFPNARFCLPHGNTLAAFTAGRKQQWEDGRPDLFEGLETTPIAECLAPNIFFDTIVHDPKTIDYLKDKNGTRNMIMGMDSPYPLGDGIPYVASNPKKWPTYTLDLAENKGYITPTEKMHILRRNVFHWIYGRGTDECIAAQERILGRK